MEAKNKMVVLMEKINPKIDTPFYNVTKIDGKDVLAAGMDLFAREAVEIKPSFLSRMHYYNSRLAGLSQNSLNQVIEENPIEVIIPLNIKLIYPENSLALLLPRSSLCLKKHIRVCNSIGLIDESFRSEHGLIVENAGFEPVVIEAGEKIAQLIFFPTFPVDIEVVKDIKETSHKGFGSSGGYKTTASIAPAKGKK